METKIELKFELNIFYILCSDIHFNVYKKYI